MFSDQSSKRITSIKTKNTMIKITR